MGTTTNITEKEKLNITGKDARQTFLADYRRDLRLITTKERTEAAYSAFLDEYLGDAQYNFVTINLPAKAIGRAIRKEQKESGGFLYDYFLPLGRELYDAVRSGTPIKEATESVLKKFLIRLNQKMLGAKYRRYNQYLRCVGVHENTTKIYSSAENTNHVHMIVEVPPNASPPLFDELPMELDFRDLFNSLIYPIEDCPKIFTGDSPGKKTKVLDVKPGRLTGENRHPEYVLKQAVNFAVGADRIFFPSAPISRGGVTDVDRTKTGCNQVFQFSRRP